PDIRGAVAARIASLVAAGGSVRLLAEVNEEVLVDLHAARLGIAVDHHHAAAVLADLGIELVVPGGEQRGRDVEPLAVERELYHLWAAGDLVAVDDWGSAEQAAHPDLAGQLRVVRIGDVVLSDVPVQPVAEVEEAVVH